MKYLNLSLSTNCSANCIFCPSNKGDKIPVKLMSIETAEQICKQLDEYSPDVISFGENGDLFLNPDAITIIKMFDKAYPQAKKVVFTNFKYLDEHKIPTILDIVYEVVCNFDSLNEDNYYATKGIKMHKPLSNLYKFLTLRDSLKSETKLSINVLNSASYQWIVKNITGHEPKKTRPTVEDDTEQTITQLVKMTRGNDTINKSYVNLWAERHLNSFIRFEVNTCPHLSRIQNELFVAPDGTCYLCCLDSAVDLQLGNIHNQTLQQIFEGDERKHLIHLLETKQFSNIGMPCITVKSCWNFIRQETGDV